jgi:hypothetical protein
MLLGLRAAAPGLPVALAGPASEADQRQILAGVGEISAPGVPGPLCIFGPDAFALAVGGSSGSAVEPVAAAGRMGKGRVAAFGHGGYPEAASLNTADTGRLMDQLIDWSAAGKARPRVGVYQLNGVAEALGERGHDVRQLDLAEIRLGEVDVLFAPSWNNPPDEVDVIQEWVRKGGGLITASTGWGWQQLHPQLDILTDFGGNKLLAPAGIAWADAYLNRTSPQGYAVDGPPPALTHAGLALDRLLDERAGGPAMSADERNQASVTLTQAARCLPPEDPLLVPRLKALAEDPDIHWIPSKPRPIEPDNLLGKIVLILQERDYRRDPAAHLQAHPAAEFHPGLVPAEAPRVTRTLDLDVSQPDWHSTGLYAAPGEPITIRLPESAVGQGLRLRIGAHADAIHGRASWHRAPRVSYDWPLEAAETELANAFGGSIYVVFPRNSQLGRVEVEIAGAVEAPRYVGGQTSPEAWRSSIRDLPGPWAEIGSDKMIITVPSAAIRDLDDPQAVVDTWDRIMDLNAELAAMPAERLRPERIVPDVEISVGYMHAGYPIMTYDDQYERLANVGHLRGEGSWGLFHEVGHNHQSGDWTFGGTGEVTVNLFTLYVYEHLVGIPVAENERGSDAFLAAQMAKYDFAAPNFEQWKGDPFLALSMYVQLQHAFGWEAYRQVFAEYRGLLSSERPADDAAKRDQWMVRFSRQVGYDLGPFFAYWGVPVSDEARDSIADLPDWLPADFPPGAVQPTPPLHTPTATPRFSPTPIATMTSIPTSSPIASATSTADRSKIYLPALEQSGG